MEFLQNKKLNKLIHSIVALVIIFAMLLTATYSWLSNQISASLTASDDYITIDPDAGLEMNYGTENNNSGKINLNSIVNDDFEFHECTSSNGKKIFFPMSEYSNDGDNDFVQNVKTSDFIYREATENDKNSKYLSVDLTLSSSSNTPVWFSKETSITGGAAKAMRIAIIENKPDGRSLVFDNSTATYGEEYSPVMALKADGSANTIDKVTCNSLSSYYPSNQNFDENGNKQALFNLEAGVTKSITINIWLEGTDANCTEDVASLEDLSIFIQFSTTSEDGEFFYFVDHTLEQWVAGDCKVFARITHEDDTTTDLPMTEDTATSWKVSLPKSTKSVTFLRYDPNSPADSPEAWNYWEAGAPGECKIYNAFAHNTGIWDDNFTGDVITFLDGTPEHLIINYNNELDENNESVTEMQVNFTTQDGNGNDIDFTYKMSYQWERSRWQIVIPSDVSDINFIWYDKENQSENARFEAAGRNGDLYYTATDVWSLEGYWSDRALYVDAANAAVEDGVMYVAYFLNDDDDFFWTGMKATNSSGKYMVGIPEGYNKVIFCRHGDWGYFDWDGVFNQTYDLTIGSHDTYIISGYTDEYIGDREYMSGYWSTRTLYVDAANAAVEDGVMYAAYFFNDSGGTLWTGMRATTSSGKYIVGVPEGYNKVIFCRRKESAGPFDWNNVYNQTYDLTIGSHNTYNITGYSGNGYNLEGGWDPNS